MAYYPNYYGQQPYPYQDQLSQLRNMPMAMPGQAQFQIPTQYSRPDQTGLTWVQGEASAKSWIVTPGTTVLLMDSESQKFYLKSADANGVPAMRTFEYTEVGADRPTQPVNAPQFVTIEEFSGFKNEVLSKLEELSAPVEVSLSRKKKGEVNE